MKLKQGTEVWSDYDESGRWCLRCRKRRGRFDLDELTQLSNSLNNENSKLNEQNQELTKQNSALLQLTEKQKLQISELMSLKE